MSRTSARPGWLNVYLLSVTVGLNMAFVFSWNRLTPLEMRRLGAGDLEISLAFAVFALAMGLGQFPGGLLMRLFGKKQLIIASTAVSGLGFFLAARASSWPAFVLGIFLQAFLGAIQLPAFLELMAQSVPSERRGQAFGLLQFFIGAALVAGPALGAWLLPVWGFRNLVMATAVAMLALAAVRSALTDTPAVKGLGFSFSHLLHGELLALTVVGTVVMSIQSLTIYGPFMAMLAKDGLKMSESDINLLFSFGALAACLVSPAAGRITQAWGSHRALMAGAGGHLIITLFWSKSAGFWPAAVLLAVSFSLFQVMAVAYDTLRITRASAYDAGPVIGATGTVSTVAASAVPPLGGLALAQAGPAGPYWLAASFGIILALAVRHLGAGGPNLPVPAKASLSPSN